MGAFLQEWLNGVAKKKVRQSTWDSYEYIVRQHLVPELGKRALVKLSPRDVQAFLNSRSELRLSPRTQQYIRAVLRMALGQAMKWGLVHQNVATLVEPAKGPARQIEPLDADQAARLLAGAKGHSQEHLFTAALGTGLRKGELLGLRWRDVDLDTGRIQVRYALEYCNGRPWRFVEPKSESGKRTVPLIGPAAAALRAQYARVKALKLKAEPGVWQEHDLVFPSEIGTPIHPTNVNREFKKLLARAGLPHEHRVHDLRHSTATYLLAAGIDPRIVMAIMGWSQVTMLARYQHVLDSMLSDAAGRLEAVFPRPAYAT